MRKRRWGTPHGGANVLLAGVFCVVDEVDSAGLVVGEEEGAVGCYERIDGATPDVSVGCLPPCGEVFHLLVARGGIELVILEADTHQLISGGHRAVPATVEADEEVATVL